MNPMRIRQPAGLENVFLDEAVAAEPGPILLSCLGEGLRGEIKPQVQSFDQL